MCDQSQSNPQSFEKTCDGSRNLTPRDLIQQQHHALTRQETVMTLRPNFKPEISREESDDDEEVSSRLISKRKGRKTVSR